MDPIWLSIAFVFGLGVRAIGLPPLVGYLLAGFALNYFGAEQGEFVSIVSDLGITLLLFTIGLKLKIKNLIKPEIWAGASLHMGITTIIFAGIVFGLSFSGLTFFSSLSWQTSLVIAFALSFSSTVFAVKILEDFGELNSYHGILAIGVLIMQDIFAVIFLVFAAGKIPNIYALGLPIALIILKPILVWLMKKIGHGELLILFGFFVALVLGAEMFKFVGLKADLGALVMGILLSNTKQTNELYKKLISFKDFFLIGFFLSIGLTGMPKIEHLYIAAILAVLINIKVILYFLVFTRFKIRARTAFFATLGLSNYSEFGLIVAAIAVTTGMIGADWLIILALALSISFIVSSPLNTKGHKIFAFFRRRLKFFETRLRLEYDKVFDIGDAEILIFGMGRIGTAVYEQLSKKYGKTVLGIELDDDKVQNHIKNNKNVLHDDATDIEFWDSVKQNHLNNQQVKIVILCMGNFNANLIAIDRLKTIGYKGHIAATGVHDDQISILKRLGVNSVYNVFTEAGIGFADHICISIPQKK